MSFLEKLFGTQSQRAVKKLEEFVEKVNANKKWAKSLSDEDFKSLTQQFKDEIKTLGYNENLKVKAFALVREAAFRVIGEEPYDVQLMGACVLDEGKILEMKTGEGKTLTSSIAAYYNALSGKGVHIITVNDYLASRDAEWMGKIYQFLGLSVGCILSNMDNEARRLAYSCDITYGTNNEFGFDYLRDNMKFAKEDKIQPSHIYCIIDEIDSILIDEARTPLIISAPDDDDSKMAKYATSIVSHLKECEKDPETGDYYEFDPLERRFSGDLNEKGDFKIDEKSKNITITSDGFTHIEEFLKNVGAIQGSLYDADSFPYVHYVSQALRARYLYKKDTDYIVENGEVKIVDEFTGRVLEGRRYSEGLHQAIEAKEGLKVLAKSKTLATITIQNFFRMYEKISGMTGTAITEEREFSQIYGLSVVAVPTHLPIQRVDANDYIFYNEKYKLDAIINEIKRVHKTGQPILVGTVSIEKSELISKLLIREGIKHNILNAKNHSREALIIAEAGKKGAVTIATNMAGRGTDIKLGGSIDSLIYKLVGTDCSDKEYRQAREKVIDEYKKSEQEVKDLGGLYILGTERHESRRIDNQLRGRAGRQGDPGFTRFYLSLDDDLMRLFASDNVRSILGNLGMNVSEPLEHKMVSRSIERAQKTVEERNYQIRKNLLDYDDIINQQRNFIYSQRDEIIKDSNILERIKNLIKTSTTIEGDKEALVKEFEDKCSLIPEDLFKDFMRYQYLSMIDKGWQDHITTLEELRESVHLRSYAQHNPLTEYKIESAVSFDNLIDSIREQIATLAVNIKINTENNLSRRNTDKTQSYNAHHREYRDREEGLSSTPHQVVRATPKIGRNDPCPCGSGKKYKNCHGR